MKIKTLFIVGFLVWLFGIFISFHNVLSGSIAFWYDPARDMMSAWDNISKLTLIGPTSGIPGIFYGPYWIWWLSFGELFSKDPEVVILITTTIPYIIFYTFLLYLFSKVIGKFSAFLLWVLYFYNFQGQITSLWNPNLAPLLFLGIIYLLTTYSDRKKQFNQIIQIFFAGIFSGIALNIHISFSIGFIVGSLIYLGIFSFLRSSKVNGVKKLVSFFISYISGILLTYVPFFIFEMRHGFSQTHTLLAALAKGGGVVMQQGLTKVEIIQNFLGRDATLLQLPQLVNIFILLAITILFISLLITKKIKLNFLQIRLICLLVVITICVLGIYMAAKNPIWPYHFIGAEILFSLFIGLVIAKVKPLQFFLAIWIVVLSFLQIQGVVKSFSTNPLLLPTLYTKEVITKTITTDAKKETYTVYAYNPAIYMYDYAYLIHWLGNRYVPYDPGLIQREGDVYPILSSGKKAALEDFVHFRSPDALYQTTKKWHFPDGTTILRRSPISS